MEQGVLIDPNKLSQTMEQLHARLKDLQFSIGGNDYYVDFWSKEQLVDFFNEPLSNDPELTKFLRQAQENEGGVYYAGSEGDNKFNSGENDAIFKRRKI